MMCNQGECCLATGGAYQLDFDYTAQESELNAKIMEQAGKISCCINNEHICQKVIPDYPGYNNQIITLTCRDVCPQGYRQIK